MNRKFRFHILGLPHTITNSEFSACAYTQKVLKFAKMMTDRGHTVIHYGHEDSDLVCTEHVTVITNKVWEETYGTHDYKSKMFTYDMNDNAYQTFFRNTVLEIERRKEKNDIILPFWGAGVRPICDAHPDLITIEPGIGYASGHWANYKIFESYAIYHAYCSLGAVGHCKQGNYDVVIPNYFDKDDFDATREKEDYFLFVGRVYDGKGVNIAIQVCEHLGLKLKVAGQLAPEYENYNWPDNVEFVGYVNIEQRKELMAKAKGSFIASQYVEPFGGVQVENLLSGTPTITSDWGAFTENNINGLTGYRCRTFDDYLKAAVSIMNGEIKSEDCREFAMKFTLDPVAEMYEKFFKDVMNIYENKGWYETDIPKKNKKPSIVIFTWGEWAFGRIYKGAAEVLSNSYDITFLNWANQDDIYNYITNWDGYDIIMGNTSLSFTLVDAGHMKSTPQAMLDKMILTFHANEKQIEYGRFKEHIPDDSREGPEWCGVTDDVSLFVDRILGVESTKTLHNFTDIDVFSGIKQSGSIKTIGMVGDLDSFNDSGWCDIKRPDMFEEIAKSAKVDHKFINGFLIEDGNKMYEGIDLLIVPSLSESFALPIIEAASCGVPVISTNMGVAQYLENINTFETVDEAVDLINKMNADPEYLKEYTSNLQNEVRSKWNKEYVVNKYWRPVIEAKLAEINNK